MGLRRPLAGCGTAVALRQKLLTTAEITRAPAVNGWPVCLIARVTIGAALVGTYQSRAVFALFSPLTNPAPKAAPITGEVLGPM